MHIVILAMALFFCKNLIIHFMLVNSIINSTINTTRKKAKSA
jgi:hypothetical protein